MSQSSSRTNVAKLASTSKEIGEIIRTFRKQQQLTLEQVSGLTHLGMRFLSELERGKETAELGKVLSLLHKLGLDIIIQPRGHFRSQPPFDRKKE